jgi:hypothetical protein
VAQAKWIAGRLERVLPTHYFHVVFNLPAQLRGLTHAHPRLVYDQLPALQFNPNGLLLDANDIPLPADTAREVLLFRAAALPEDQREQWLNYARAYPPTTTPSA